MFAPKENSLENKKSHVIDDLVENGVFKVEGKQLYELSLFELMKETIDKDSSNMK
ncbi:Fur-regulated basic protein FbpA [Paenisporosarcina cavernae]|uniref:Fur-regulated basic protein FbpA n=1 Tax=Paenisporosarcina cavernae TaxID=2320858 RepID=A0A385YUA6_9BACL|nr:Fur-regulated basic protein FbpA [Paenisporosarcina cavernae]AYC30266.1 Fur-regulated basic protein FbpA [Paenisporosarcina cavernae]